jgi:surface protein
MITPYSNIISVTTEKFPFEFTINTANTSTGSTAADQFKLPLVSSLPLNAVVNWGDGSSDTITVFNQAETTHTYDTSSTTEFTVSITGDLSGWQFNNGGDRLKMLDVKQWSALNISVSNGFQGCTNLTASATDAPLITTTSLGSYFRSCSNFNGAIGNWDVSNVSSMSYMFFQANLFNANLNNWDTSSLSDSRGLFRGTAFNGDISNWNTSNLLLVAEMFQDTSAFNQNISTKTVNLGQPNEYIAWDTSNVTAMNLMFLGSQAFNQDISNWDVSNVTNFFQCFQSNPVFNQNIGSWDVSNVSNFGNMFFNADAFDQDISAWDINQVTNFSNFMASATGLSTTNYDLLLVGWEAQAPTSGLSVNFGGSQYTLGSAAATARASLISTYGWTITDGGGI